MLQRDKLNALDPKYMPIHRLRIHKRDERIITKYIGQMTWYQDEDFGDPFRRDWKRWIRKKEERGVGRRRNNKGSGGGAPQSDVTNVVQELNKPTTTVMFVPASRNSELLKGIMEAERKVSERSSWKARILEQPGVPLLLSFHNRFPILEGCCRGVSCILCGR